MMIKREIYYREVMQNAPRILNLLNRNPSSKNYGSFDRDFWNYNAFDISNARKQEAILTLALLYSIDEKDNPYYGNEMLLSWINGALRYTCRLQHSNGSFDEMYPNEHSYVATAFLTYAICETVVLLKEKVTERQRVVSMLEKACKWLMSHDEKSASNQKAGAACALRNVFLLTQNKEYEKAASKLISELKKEQSDEGWFFEYGGPDIGYLSLTIDYLSKYHKNSKNKDAQLMIEKALEFLSYFCFSDGTFGGEIGSRNTEYVIPHGIELFARHDKNAKKIAGMLRQSISIKATISPSTIDDRYLLFNSYTYLQAFIDGQDTLEIKHETKQYHKAFAQAGIVCFSRKGLQGCVNLKKGGVLKIIFQNRSSLNDGGCVLERDGKKLASNHYKEGAVLVDKHPFVSRRNLMPIRQTNLTPLTNILFRTFQLTLGRMNWLSHWMRERVRKSIIRQKDANSGVSYARTVSLGEEKIMIEDVLTQIKKTDRVIVSSKLSFIFAESSRFFQKTDLFSRPLFIECKNAKKNEIRIRRTYDKDGKLIDISY